MKISEDILLYRFHLGGRCNGLEKSLLTFHCFCAILFYKYIKNAMIKQADRDYKRPRVRECMPGAVSMHAAESEGISLLSRKGEEL